MKLFSPFSLLSEFNSFPRTNFLHFFYPLIIKTSFVFVKSELAGLLLEKSQNIRSWGWPGRWEASILDRSNELSSKGSWCSGRYLFFCCTFHPKQVSQIFLENTVERGLLEIRKLGLESQLWAHARSTVLEANNISRKSITSNSSATSLTNQDAFTPSHWGITSRRDPGHLPLILSTKLIWR